jgi:AcrR family transcriptional regulator
MSAEIPEIRQKRRKDERPDEILAAALTIFSRDGFSGARLDEIAELAGCTKGTIYVYFNSKEELFKAVVRKLITPEFRRADSILMDETLPATTRLKMFIKGGYRAAIDNPQSFAMLRLLIADGPKFPDLVDFYHSQIPRVGHEMIRATIQQGIDRGEFRPLDADMAAHVLVGPILAEVTRRLLLASRQLDLEPLIDTHVDMMFNGMLVKPAQESGEQTSKKKRREHG